MEQITPAQKNQLASWASQRDALLGEVSALETKKQNLTKDCEALATSKTEITADINRGLGRLEEIEKREKERAALVSKDVADLEVQKTHLQSEIPGLKETIIALMSKKSTLESTIASLTDVHDRVFTRTAALEAIVDHVSRVSSENVTMIQNCLLAVEKSTGEIVEINRKNVAETMIVIEKLPRAILEYRRPTPMVRTILSKKSPLENGAAKK